MQNSIGKPLIRVDGRAKVTGQARYTAEQPVPQAAYGVVVLSAIAKGRIASLEIASATRVPGVLAVLTHRNTPKLPQKPHSAAQADRPADRKLQLLQDDRVLYADQPIAVVVAETLKAAQQGAAAVAAAVRYAEELHSVELDAARAVKPSQGGAHGESNDESRGDDVAGAPYQRDAGGLVPIAEE